MLSCELLKFKSDSIPAYDSYQNILKQTFKICRHGYGVKPDHVAATVSVQMETVTLTSTGRETEQVVMNVPTFTTVLVHSLNQKPSLSANMLLDTAA